MRWKKIYEEFFYIPEEGKLRERVFLSRIIFSILLVLMYLGFMGISAFAYFVTGQSFGTSLIQSAKFDLDVQVHDVTMSQVAGGENGKILPNEEGYFILSNISEGNNAGIQDKIYEVVLNLSDDATASNGYAKIEVLTDVNKDGSRQVYYTAPMGTVVEKEQFKIQLLVPANKSAKIKVIAEWGTCSRERVLEDGSKFVPDYMK